RARSCVGGHHDLRRESVELCLNDYPHALEKIRQAISAHDPSAVEHHAHSLKGSVSTFGAKDAFEAALALERKGRSGALAGVEGGLSELGEAIELLSQALEDVHS